MPQKVGEVAAGQNLLAVGNEVSGTTTVFAIEGASAKAPVEKPMPGSVEGSATGPGFVGVLTLLVSLAGLVFGALVHDPAPGQIRSHLERHWR